MSNHLSDELAAAFLEGNVTNNECSQVEWHLLECAYCRRNLADTALLLREVDLLPPPVTGPLLEHWLNNLRRLFAARENKY